MTVTVIITLKSPSGQYIRDTRETHASGLVWALSKYIERGFEIVAIERLEGSVLDFYSKRMTDADLDAMAEQNDVDVPE